VAISYLRSVDASRSAQRAHRRLTAAPARGGGGRRWAAVSAVLLVLVALGVTGFVFASSKGSLSPDGAALARIDLPLGGGTIERVTVLSSPKESLVPVMVKGDPTIWPTAKVPAHERLQVMVTIRRPSWISWLTGATEHLRMSITAPSASLYSHYLTVKSGAPLVLRFKSPIRTLAYGEAGHMTKQTFSTPTSQVTIARPAEAGTMAVRATLRTWEKAKSAPISWFPAGGSATAVATPSPGTAIKPSSSITLTFNRPVATVLGGHLPPVTPAGAGSWHELSSHAIQFVPTGYGYGLGADVNVALPAGVRLVGGHAGASSGGSWHVPGGSTVRLQQLLAQLGYLPFHFNQAGPAVGSSAQAQEQAAVKPPQGSFAWAYPNIPGALRSMWAPGTFGTMTKGAVMAFENNSGLSVDGAPGATVWKTLIDDVVQSKGASTFGYTFVTVSEGSPEGEQTWHNGSVRVSGPVNTGIAAAPTAQGVFTVFEHVPSTTMSGVNPDGSSYSDPGVLWVSYFNGGDALHEFPRGSYGYPQSLGCVEMPDGEAAAVYPYTPIGTLVDVV
jgi:peptidoglycan hydrolase-like protein with peptidoglycan-binding domain